MREILFKAKRVDNGEWVEGYYIKATHHWHDHGNQDVWNWYDNIDSASAYFDEESQMAVVSIHFKDVDANIVVAITDVAFLCNDNGQTIEKLTAYRKPTEKHKNSV